MSLNNEECDEDCQEEERQYVKENLKENCDCKDLDCTSEYKKILDQAKIAENCNDYGCFNLKFKKQLENLQDNCVFWDEKCFFENLKQTVKKELGDSCSEYPDQTSILSSFFGFFYGTAPDPQLLMRCESFVEVLEVLSKKKLKNWLKKLDINIGNRH